MSDGSNPPSGGVSFPCFYHNRELKAHGSSEACFDFSDPRSPTRGPSGSPTRLRAGYLWPVCTLTADGRARPGLLRRSVCSLSGLRDPAPAAGRASGSAPPGRSLAKGLRSFAMFQAQDKLSWSHGTAGSSRPVCFRSAGSPLTGEQAAWGRARLGEGPGCFQVPCAHLAPVSPGKSVRPARCAASWPFRQVCFIHLGEEGGVRLWGEGCPSGELGFPGQTTTDRGQCVCRACICRVQGGHLSSRRRQGLQANRGSPGHREQDPGARTVSLMIHPFWRLQMGLCT